MSLPSPTPSSYALVTGASQGIGEALARRLGALGHNVILVARREEVLTEIAADIASEHGVKTIVAAHDLSDPDSVTELIEKMAETEIHILINSAGIATFGPFVEQDWQGEVAQFDLNATAVFRLTKAATEQMVPRRSGAICNVGSVAGNMPIPNNATYVFTKAGVNAFTEALHYELKKHNVACTLLAPGPVREAEIPESEKSIVDKVVPDFLWTTYESCAEDTLDALAKNKRRIVPGTLSKGMEVISRIAPRRLIAPLMGWFYSGMAE